MERELVLGVVVVDGAHVAAGELRGEVLLTIQMYKSESKESCLSLMDEMASLRKMGLRHTTSNRFRFSVWLTCSK